VGARAAAEAEAGASALGDGGVKSYYDVGEEDSGMSAVLDTWRRAIRSVREALQRAHALCTREADLSSRLDSRVVMLREEIEVKMRMVGISDI